MRMVEARRKPRLTQEALSEAVVVRQLLYEHLDGDPTASPRVLGEVDRAHRSLPDQGLQAKPGQNRACTDGGTHRLFTSLTSGGADLKGADVLVSLQLVTCECLVGGCCVI